MESGSWKVEVKIGTMPQKVATAFSKFQENLVGAEYELVAYLGSQVVNGINHAVLAKQIVTTGKDSENLVVLIFNEKPNGSEATLVNIERVVEGNSAFGGTKVDVKTKLDEDLQELWDKAFEAWMGARVVPFAFLGTQVTKDTNYIFAAVYTATMYPDDIIKVVAVTVNPLENRVTFADMLESKYEASLGYAFSW